jgi:hypothetical protein
MNMLTVEEKKAVAQVLQRLHALKRGCVVDMARAATKDIGRRVSPYRRLILKRPLKREATDAAKPSFAPTRPKST